MEYTYCMQDSPDFLASELAHDSGDAAPASADDTKKEVSSASQKRQIQARATLLRLMSYLFRQKFLLVVAIVFLMATGAIEASFVKSIDTVLKSGFLNGDDWFVRWSGMLLMGVLAARAITGYIGNYTMAKAGRLVIFELRRDIFGNMI